MPIQFGSTEATVRLLPTTSPKDAVARLTRLNSGQCHNLVLTGIRGGTWNLGQFCSVIEAATHLAEGITSLDFSKMDLDETFLLFAIDLVKRCPLLRRVDFEESYFTALAAAELGRALSDKPNLSYVNLSRCDLTDESAIAFVAAILAKKSPLKHGEVCGFALHLPHNNIDTAFATQMAESFLTSPTAHHINSVSFFGNFISNTEGHKVHSACQKRRLMLEEKRNPTRNGAASSSVSSPTSAAQPRTSLGFLVESCADSSEAGAFPTVSAMAKMLVEEEGL